MWTSTPVTIAVAPLFLVAVVSGIKVVVCMEVG